MTKDNYIYNKNFKWPLDIKCTEITDEQFAAFKRKVINEWPGSGNGHSEYMIANISEEEKEDFLRLLCIIEKNLNHRCTILGLEYENKAFTFHTFENSPGLTQLISSAFPNAICYGVGAWDYCYVESYKGGDIVKVSDTATCTIDKDCLFIDGDGIRIDVDVTDKQTGNIISYGDLITGENAEEIRQSDTFYDIIAYLSEIDKARIESLLNDFDVEREQDR